MANSPPVQRPSGSAPARDPFEQGQDAFVSAVRARVQSDGVHRAVAYVRESQVHPRWRAKAFVVLGEDRLRTHPSDVAFFIPILHDVVRVQPEYGRAVVLLARLLIPRGEFAQALRVLDGARFRGEHQADTAELRQQCRDALARATVPAAPKPPAQPIHKDELDLRPRTPPPVRGLVDRVKALGARDLRAAIEHAQATPADHAGRAEALGWCAAQARELHHPPVAARALFEQALASNATYVPARIGLAGCLMVTEAWEEALQHLDRAELLRDDASIALRQARCHLALEDVPAAQACFGRAERLSRGTADADAIAYVRELLADAHRAATARRAQQAQPPTGKAPTAQTASAPAPAGIAAPRSVEEALRAAVAAGDWETAEREAQHALASRPGEPLLQAAVAHFKALLTHLGRAEQDLMKLAGVLGAAQGETPSLAEVSRVFIALAGGNGRETQHQAAPLRKRKSPPPIARLALAAAAFQHHELDRARTLLEGILAERTNSIHDPAQRLSELIDENPHERDFPWSAVAEILGKAAAERWVHVLGTLGAL